MVFTTQVIRSDVIETGFGFYTDESIRKLSVCQITSSVSQDALGNYIQGYFSLTTDIFLLNWSITIQYSGLYDSKLGCTEIGVACPTCGLSYVNCPGHCGHIELDLPV